MKLTVFQHLSEANSLTKEIINNTILHNTLCDIASICVDSLLLKGKIILAGNGGSAADAQHIAGELVSRFMKNRPALAAIALTTDTSVITAIGNDYGFDHLFARQIEALGRPGDIFIAYSTSGNSSNIINALKVARSLGLVCVGFTGNRRGLMCTLCDYLLEVPSSSTPRIQEGHLLLGHTLCALIENVLFPAEE